MTKRKRLFVESLEDRRVLSVVPVGGDGNPLPSFDPQQAGEEMAGFYRELGVARGSAGTIIMPMVAAQDVVSVDVEPEVPQRPMPIEARQFIAVLRPVPKPPAESGNGEQMDGANQGEGEPTRIPEWVRGGMARFFLARDDAALRYRVRVPNLAGVDSAAVHLGKPGSGGPAVATLFDLNVGELDGIAVRGQLTDDDISPVEELGFDGTVASLVQAMRDGEAYVEVDSADLDGALRGAVRPLGWRPWHNPLNRMDVTGDKIVTPQDALAVVEDLNEKGARLVEPPMPDEPPVEWMYTDVTGDNVVSPRDALELIQFLTDRAGDLVDGNGNVVLPETISETVEELMGVLEIDPADWPDVDYGQVLDNIMNDQSGEVESLLDRLAEDLQNEYERRYAEWTGTDPSSFDMPEIDWEQMYAEFRDQMEDPMPPIEDMEGMMEGWRDQIGSWFGRMA